MNKREMAKALRDAHLSINVDGHQLSLGELAAATLEREAEREERERQKVTLEEQAKACLKASRGYELGEDASNAAAAAKTLDILMTRGPLLNAGHVADCRCSGCCVLRDLGVDLPR